jgi:hypothetical protein
LAFAGVAAVLLSLSVYLLVPVREPMQFRSDREISGTELKLIPENNAVVRDPSALFRWTSAGDSLIYRFSLMEQTGAILWSHDLRDTAVQLPRSVVLQPGNTYLWRVETFVADRSAERSALHAFTYAPQ